MNSPQRIALAALAAQPWKNGAGLTRELAVEPPSASMDDFSWRISIAEVDRDAPFSAFPGIDRCITLLRGAGLRLVGGAADRPNEHRLDQPLTPFTFPGDLPLVASLLGGACADFNVMTRRGLWRAEVTVARQTAELEDADATVLLAAAGAWQLDSGATDHDTAWTLGLDEALLWRTRRGVFWATPRDAGAALLCVRLCHDPGS